MHRYAWHLQRYDQQPGHPTAFPNLIARSRVTYVRRTRLGVFGAPSSNGTCKIGSFPSPPWSLAFFSFEQRENRIFRNIDFRGMHLYGSSTSFLDLFSNFHSLRTNWIFRCLYPESILHPAKISEALFVVQQVAWRHVVTACSTLMHPAALSNLRRVRHCWQFHSMSNLVLDSLLLQSSFWCIGARVVKFFATQKYSILLGQDLCGNPAARWTARVA